MEREALLDVDAPLRTRTRIQAGAREDGTLPIGMRATRSPRSWTILDVEIRRRALPMGEAGAAEGLS